MVLVTLVSARPSFSWGPRRVMVSLSSLLGGISTKTPVSARISLIALPRGPITYRCWVFFTSTCRDGIVTITISIRSIDTTVI